MNIHLFTSESIIDAIRLVKIINSNRKFRDNFIIKTISIEEIRHEMNIEIDDLIILMIRDANELQILIDHRYQFSMNRVIIVFSEYNVEVINKSYLLNPRFIEFTDSDYINLIEVINNISREQNRHYYVPRTYRCEYHQGGAL